MGSVTNEDNATTVPLFDLQPLDRTVMNLFVALQSSQIVSDELAEGGETAAKPFQSPFHRIVPARLSDIGKTIRAALDRAHAEETAITQPELNAVKLLRTDRCHTAPHHLSTVGRRRRSRAQHELARRRMNPISTDHNVVFTGRTIAEHDRHTIIILT